MRLWHKDLIPVLPRKQLLSQWRECCALAKTIATKGTPNHLLVNKIMNYPLGTDFYMYCQLVTAEMANRSYKVNKNAYSKFIINLQMACENGTLIWDPEVNIFKDWHNDRYLTQCYYNLQEKFDCGGIPIQEWRKVQDLYDRRNKQVNK